MNGRRGKRLRLLVACSVVVFIFIQLPCHSKRNWLINKNITDSSSPPNSSVITVEKKVDSVCSRRATERGIGQKIISISFFGPVENRLFSINNSLILLTQLINEMQQVYANKWILRVYHDGRILNQTLTSHFQHLYNSVDLCNITELNLTFLPQKIWRFLPSIDETVNIMASRDLDSPLTQREKAAMDEWILSNLTFHSMRDHPYHAAPIMGGMWAFRVDLDRNFSQVIRSKLFDRPLITQYSMNRDQQFLADHIWGYAKEKAMSHASYWCTTPGWNKYHRPFPTQRPTRSVTNNCFIGCPKPCCIGWTFAKDPCPVECRPKEHQDWIYC